MKKLLAIILALVMCIGLLAGCNNQPEATEAPTEAPKPTEKPAENQGADATFLSDMIERVCAALGRSRAEVLANSFLVSADNAHAVHPNHPEYADATHRPHMNEGIVIKQGVRYATDGAAQAVFTAVCRIEFAHTVIICNCDTRYCAVSSGSDGELHPPEFLKIHSIEKMYSSNAQCLLQQIPDFHHSGLFE